MYPRAYESFEELGDDADALAVDEGMAEASEALSSSESEDMNENSGRAPLSMRGKELLVSALGSSRLAAALETRPSAKLNFSTKQTFDISFVETGGRSARALDTLSPSAKRTDVPATTDAVEIPDATADAACFVDFVVDLGEFELALFDDAARAEFEASVAHGLALEPPAVRVCSARAGSTVVETRVATADVGAAVAIAGALSEPGAAGALVDVEDRFGPCAVSGVRTSTRVAAMTGASKRAVGATSVRAAAMTGASKRAVDVTSTQPAVMTGASTPVVGATSARAAAMACASRRSVGASSTRATAMVSKLKKRAPREIQAIRRATRLGEPLVILLVSGITIDATTRARQQRSVALLKARGVAFEQIDGADAKYKNMRDRLFAISGRRGEYPQFFVAGEGSADSGAAGGAPPRFVGLWDTIEQLNECEDAAAAAAAADGAARAAAADVQLLDYTSTAAAAAADGAALAAAAGCVVDGVANGEIPTFRGMVGACCPAPRLRARRGAGDDAPEAPLRAVDRAFITRRPSRYAASSRAVVPSRWGELGRVLFCDFASSSRSLEYDGISSSRSCGSTIHEEVC